jgi:(1->4)-alpha-D-glucan 1-alpha-D-glucosylmutase
VQLHRGFTFSDLAGIADYLAALGITHAYLSPALQAAAGSTHGYDVVDPSRLNPELGGREAFAELTQRVHDLGMGQVLDIVPNHMALDGRDNTWWWDVLANGPSSPYARYFDIDWDSRERKLVGSVLVPVLGDHYGRVLEAGQIRLEREGGSFVVRYMDHTLPVSPRSIDSLLSGAAAELARDPATEAHAAALSELAEGFGDLPHALIVEPDLAAERHQRSRLLQDSLGRLAADNPDVAHALDTEVKAFNDDADRLDELLQRQNYRLAFWRTASEELDYRRFFNIETLVGLRVEDEKVFRATHQLIIELVAEGLIDGVRVDHIDGLRDPDGYLVRLDQATGHRWIVVEKILAPDETLPATWPVAGTTGYDFLNRVNALFVAPDNLEALTDAYQAFVGGPVDYAEAVHDSKMQIMREELAAEVERLTEVMAEVCERHRRQRDYTRRELRGALREVLAAFSVYRCYVRPGAPVRPEDRRVIEEAVTVAAERRPDLDPELFAFIGALLCLEFPGFSEEELCARFQQLSGPVMAKGVEDTAFYRYHRLTSLNEVGGSPDTVDAPVGRFHAHCGQGAESWPEALLTLATHDTKRGPDTRARINVLSEIPDAWRQVTQHWAAHNDAYRRGEAPERNDEYLLYQTLVGAWPIEAERVGAYMEKATKEAKVRTSWVSPDAGYDEAVQSFVAAVMDDEWFRADLERFLAEHRLVERGRRNSLAQTALLLTAPGYADVYQGTELWDHSLVDPDNRRPVDYDVRRRVLAGLTDEPPAVDDTGAAKLWLIHQLAADRRRRPEAYRAGSRYKPLTARGLDADRVVAFWRTGGLVVAVPRLSHGATWADTTLDLPEGAWADVLTSAPAGSGEIPVATLLSLFPVAVLRPA